MSKSVLWTYVLWNFFLPCLQSCRIRFSVSSSNNVKECLITVNRLLAACLGSSVTYFAGPMRSFSQEEKHFVTPCKFLFCGWYRIQQSHLGRNMTVCSIWISISVKHLSGQPLKTEEKQTYTNICNAALGKKEGAFLALFVFTSKRSGPSIESSTHTAAVGKASSER